MTQFEACKGPLCPNFDAICETVDTRLMWPSGASAESIAADCTEFGEELLKVAPQRLEVVDGCAAQALGDLVPGRTHNPIKAIQNRLISRKLGIVHIPEERIIH